MQKVSIEPVPLGAIPVEQWKKRSIFGALTAPDDSLKIAGGHHFVELKIPERAVESVVAMDLEKGQGEALRVGFGFPEKD